MRRVVKIAFLTLCICAFAGVLWHTSTHAQAEEPELEPLMVGTDQLYKTLNAALIDAEDGQIIQIVGSIIETNPANPVTINKSVIIQGDGVSSSYSVTGWNKPASPVQITAENVEIKDLNLTVNSNVATAVSSILVNASGLSMEDVNISSTLKSGMIVNLQGNSAQLKKVAITAGANATGLYSETSPARLVLDECSFTVTAATAKSVSLPAPVGLTLNKCNFHFTGSGTGYGLVFVTPSNAMAVQTLEANNCVFNMNAAGTGIDLNGYNGTFTGCEFNYSKGGTGIISQSPSDAVLAFTDCGFYMGKNSGERANSAKGLVLKNSDHGDILIDGCTLIASCDPAAEMPTSATSAVMIHSTDGMLERLSIKNSNVSLNAGAGKAVGVNASAEKLMISESEFHVNVANAKSIVVSDVINGSVDDCNFNIAQSGAMGLSLTDSNSITLVNNVYNLSESGNGVTMTNAAAGTSSVVVDKNTVNIQGYIVSGLLFENFNSLAIKNKTMVSANHNTRSSMGTCIVANQIKTVVMDELDIDINTRAEGIFINGTKFPQGQEGSVRITNMTANLSEGTTSRGVRIWYADGVLVENYVGVCENGADNSVLLGFHNSVDVRVRNCQFDIRAKGATGLAAAAGTGSVIPTDENGVMKEHISEKYVFHNNVFHVGEGAKAINVSGKRTHHVAIHHNKVNTDKAASGIGIGYGRNHTVYSNEFESESCGIAIISDGVDEDATFSIDKDDDMYEEGEIVDAYRNQIYNNVLKGSYERGIYVSNNGDIIRDNDFSNATFDYESTPGTISNTQIIVAFCKDVKILDNKFTKARALDNQVVRLYNGTISMLTGNTVQMVEGASEVLFVQGTLALAPNGMKYPESVTVHDLTNTINGAIPMEVLHEWSDPDNLLYEYILKVAEVIPEYPPDFELDPDEEEGTVIVEDEYKSPLGEWEENENGWSYHPNPDVNPPSTQIMPRADGSFEAIDQDGTSIGEWRKTEENRWGYRPYQSEDTKVWIGLLFALIALGVLPGIFYFFIWARRHITREEFVRMIVRAIHLETEIGETTPYTDVSDDYRYYDDIMSAKSAGLLLGFPDSEFKPRIAITREEIGSILAETKRYENNDLSIEGPVLSSIYKDFDKIDERFIRDIRLIAYFEIMVAKADGAFDPEGLSTRAQASKMIRKLLSLT